MEFGPHELNT